MANMPPKPTVPIARVSHTCERLNAPSSVRTEVAGISVMCGRRNHKEVAVAMPMQATST